MLMIPCRNNEMESMLMDKGKIAHCREMQLRTRATFFVSSTTLINRVKESGVDDGDAEDASDVLLWRS